MALCEPLSPAKERAWVKTIEHCEHEDAELVLAKKFVANGQK